ncbi:MAG TPA: serine hydrolase [Planktothrix sp.]|jgi:beta-lactamase class A
MPNEFAKGRRTSLFAIFAALVVAMLFSPMADAQAQTPDTFAKLQTTLDQIVATFSGQASVEFRDLSSDEVVAYSNSADMPAASTIKIPVMVEVFRQIAAGELHLRDQVQLRSDDKDKGSGMLAYMKSGSKYSIQYLLTVMITVSDNTATNMLIRVAGLDNINNTMESLGLTHTKLADFVHTDTVTGDVRLLRSSAEDMTTLLTMMYKGTLVDSASSSAMLDILSKQKHNGLIPRPLPKGLRIAHKTGTLNDTLNDVGIVFVKQHPYVLAVMTTGLSKGERAELIHNISRAVYVSETASAPTTVDKSRPKLHSASRETVRVARR